MKRPSFARRILAVGFVLSVGISACGPTDDPVDDPVDEESDDEEPAEESAPQSDDDEEVFTLNYANALTDGELPSRKMEQWAEAVNERSEGRLQVEIFHASTLVPPAELTEAFRDGRAQGGYMFPEFMPAEFPLLLAGGMPYVTMDPGAWADAWNMLYQENEATQRELQSAGVHVLTHIPTHAAAIGLPEPVSSLDDLAGLRIRSFGLWAEALEEVGATPVFMSTGEALEGLERGVVDAIAPQDMVTIVDRGMVDIVPHLLMPQMGMYIGTAHAVSLDFWESLPEDLQQILEEEAVQIMHEEKALEWMDEGERACEQLRDVSGTVTLLSDEDNAEFEERVSDALWESWRQGAIDAGNEPDEVDEVRELYLSAVDQFEGTRNYQDATLACGQRS